MGAITLRPEDTTWPVIEVAPETVHTVGRHASNVTTLRHASISRQHAELKASGTSLLIRDLHSRNGTYVNGVRVQEGAAQDGDLLQFGSIRYRVHAESPASSSQRLVKSFRAAGETFVSSGSNLAVTALRASLGAAPETATARLATMLSIANALAGSTTGEQLGERILDKLADILTFDRAALLLFDDAGRPQPIVLRPKESLSAVSSHLSMTIVREALDRGEAVLTSDATEDPRFQAAESIVGYTVRSALCLPLQTSSGQIGALYFDTLALPGSFSEGDLEYLSAFATQAALALSHMQLQRKLREDAVVRTNLSRFFSPATMREILARDSAIRLGGEEREVTVLFSDIRGFTSLGERLAPRQIAEMLNEYLPQMVDIVFAHDGTMEKYIGDALLAVWGAPVAHANDPELAVHAAINMQETVAELNAWWRSDGRPYTIDIGIGISTGVAYAGNIGSEHYLQYATIGDATNSASRLSDAAGAGEILVIERTASLVADGAVTFSPPRELPVKGKREVLTVRNVLYAEADTADARN